MDSKHQVVSYESCVKVIWKYNDDYDVVDINSDDG